MTLSHPTSLSHLKGLPGTEFMSNEAPPGGGGGGVEIGSWGDFGWGGLMVEVGKWR